MDRAVILVGTEAGNAEDVADELAETIEEAGFEVETLDMEDADTGVFGGGSTSTRRFRRRGRTSVGFSSRCAL